jgi:glycosyltransferase involved in cell wall biosynthesis
LEEFTSVEELSMDIVRLLTDEKETEKRIQKQLQYVKANHSAPVLAKKLDKIYEKLT